MTHAQEHVLVTGGAGYIGSHVVMALMDAGYKIVVVDDLSTGHSALIPTGVPRVIGNAGDKDLITRVIQDYAVMSVMHFAGSIVIEESIENPMKYYINNTETSRRLIEYCQINGVNNFVFSSSAAVYGDPAEVPVTEDTVLKPINPYGMSKLMTEHMLMDIAAAGDLRFAILRYFNVAGADLGRRSGQVGLDATHLIRIAVEAAIGIRAEVPIYGDDYNTADGTCVRDFIHVSDLANAHVLALERLMCKRDNMILNCGYGRGYSVKQVLEAVERVANIALNIKVEARRDGDAAQLVASADRIRAVLKWRPEIDNIDTIVGSALGWEKQRVLMDL